MNPKSLWELVKTTFYEWNEDKAPRLGAALAYYSVFSLAPLLIIVIGIAGIVFGRQAAQGEIVEEIGHMVGQPGAQAIEDMLQQTGTGEAGILASVVGVVIMLFGASGVFLQLQDALNTVWKVAPKPGRGIWGFVRDRFLSFSVVLGIGFLLLVSLIISAALAALGKFVTSGALPGGTFLWQIVNFVISFGLVSLFFALIFKILPDVKMAWRDVWVGAVVTALLFTIGKFLIGLYLGQSAATSGFGAAASLVLVLLWIYYSSQILLLGAEFTRAYAMRFGSHVVPTENAVVVNDEKRVREGMPRSKQLVTTSRG